jgi:RND superfamily putative drug exporter
VTESITNESSKVSGKKSQTKKSQVKGRKALWIAVISIISWLAIGGFSGAAFSKISTVQENDNSSFLPDSAESTLAGEIIVKFSQQSQDLLPTLLLLVGDLNPATNTEAFGRVSEYAATLGAKVLPESGKALSTYFSPSAPIQPIPSADGKAILINVQLDSAIAGENIDKEPVLPMIIEFIREDMKSNLT